jgi:hypothetical protein
MVSTNPPNLTTPVKPRKRRYDGTSITVIPSSYKTKASEVEFEIRHELHESVFVDTPQFAKKLFDVPPDLVEDVYLKACDGNHPLYDVSNTAWTRFSTKPQFEKELYAPFVKVANFITASCGESRNLDVSWLSDPNRAPALEDSSAAEMKPDIISVLGFPASAQYANEKAPWRRINVPMEVKKASSDSAAILQLLKYLRQVFREAFDRRFVFGIVLARKNVTIYLADRSGVLGSEVFDIHKVGEGCKVNIYTSD